MRALVRKFEAGDSPLVVPSDGAHEFCFRQPPVDVENEQAGLLGGDDSLAKVGIESNVRGAGYSGEDLCGGGRLWVLRDLRDGEDLARAVVNAENDAPAVNGDRGDLLLDLGDDHRFALRIEHGLLGGAVVDLEYVVSGTRRGSETARGVA